jgi:hypothetical protein
VSGASVTSKDLFLFCNHGFGWPFSKRIVRRLRKRTRVTLVYSGRLPITMRRGTIAPIRARFIFFIRKVSIQILAWMYGATVRTVPDVNAPEFIRTIPAGAEGIVAGFNQIFKREAIESFGALVNFHASLLPLYRGPVPCYWVLKAGEQRTGYTLHRISELIDKGEILFQEAISCKGVRSEYRLDSMLARAAQHTLDRYISHRLDGEPWRSVRLDAFSIYAVQVNYGRRPEPDGNGAVAASKL